MPDRLAPPASTWPPTPSPRVLAAIALALAYLLAAPAGAQQAWLITSPIVITSPTEQLGDVIVASGGSLSVIGVSDPGFRLTGNLLVTGTGQVSLLDSVIQIESTYHGQYSVVASDDASVTVSGCEYHVPNHVQHALIVTGNAVMTLEDTAFDAVQLIANANGSLDGARLDGEFEVILQDPARVFLEDVPRAAGKGDLWVWPEFPPGSVAIYSPPLPGFIESWSFPPLDATGIAQSCELRRCQVKLWPLLVREGSDLTLKDIAPQNWVVVGLHLPNPTVVSQLVNNQTVAYAELPLADRRLVLENAAIDAWNLYPESAATVTVQDSVIGELLASGSAQVALARTTVDGSGGYFGATDSATIDAEGCTFTCDVQASHQATIAVHRSQLRPYPFDATGAQTHFGAFDDGRLFVHQTTTSSTASGGGSGLIVFAVLADPPSSPPPLGSELALIGTIAAFSPDATLLPIAWNLQAKPVGVADPLLLGSGPGNVTGGRLGTWAGQRAGSDWELRVTVTDAKGRTLAGSWPVPYVRAVRRHLHSNH